MNNNNYWLDCSNLPKRHNVIVVIFREGREYVITYLDTNTDIYYLFEKINNKFVKLGQGKNTLKLEKKYIDKIGEENDD